MRTTPLIGRKVWFGPRRSGWGWSPATGEGWAVLAGGVVAAIALAATVPWAPPTAAAVMLAVIYLKGTSPGGTDQWYEFLATRDRHAGQDDRAPF